jgi:hypothetical protein
MAFSPRLFCASARLGQLRSEIIRSGGTSPAQCGAPSFLRQGECVIADVLSRSDAIAFGTGNAAPPARHSPCRPGQRPLGNERGCIHHAGMARDGLHAEAHPLLAASVRRADETGEKNKLHGETIRLARRNEGRLTYLHFVLILRRLRTDSHGPPVKTRLCPPARRPSASRAIAANKTKRQVRIMARAAGAAARRAGCAPDS